jgi:diguanylate cyclase (GGDEF)-like protein
VLDHRCGGERPPDRGYLLNSPTKPASEEVTAEVLPYPGAAGKGRSIVTSEGGELPIESEAFDLVGILSAIDETAYTWDLVSDRMDWESNAATVLGVRNAADIATGSAFQAGIAAEHLGRRNEAISASQAKGILRGVPYRVQYRFQPQGLRSSVSIWLEDHGRWWPGADGRPARARGVVRVINEKYWDEQRQLQNADQDELTGQLNRHRLTEALSAVVSRSERSRMPCAFLVAGVNNLAVINETFGYDVGDEVLRQVARIIREKLRGGDTLGRFSSNKFGIILNDCGPGAMRIAADRFIKAVKNTPIRTPACQISATISVGGVIIPDQASSPQNALSHALQALEKAKHKRNDTFMAYEPSPVRESARVRNSSISEEVLSALDEGRMYLVLQPMVSAKTGKPEIYECLLRMARIDGSTISAGDFIPVAEQLGLSRLIDRRTLELSVELLRKHPEIVLSVNVSSLTAGDHEWIVTLHKLTGGRADLTKRIIVEITETAAIHDIDQTIAFVDTLKELGCRVAIDDFGAGYTSFKNLKVLNADMVKIDGAFVKDVLRDTGDQVFIKSMIELASTFGMETVAEWVGDEETAAFLRKMGVNYLQGFHYGMPIRADTLSSTFE